MKKIILKILPLIAALVLLCVSVMLSVPEVDVSSSKQEIPAAEEKPSLPPEEKEEEISAVKTDEQEMRAVWIPFMSLDTGGTDRSEKAFSERIGSIMKKCREIGANTVVFHARPFSDALYPSDIFPSSHIITGKQGEQLSYDPLAIAVESAGKYGLKFHAWINPLRVRFSQSPPELSQDNPYMKWKNNSDPADDRYTFTSDGNIYYNPAYPEVRKMIIDGAREIVGRYDIDGLQIDDYFYPGEGGDYDDKEYEEYKNGTDGHYLTKAQWRRQNINMLVSGLYDAVHSRSGCVFGISPQGNTENDLKMGADVFLWCSQSGYADYICPQLYVSEDHPVLPFGKAAKQWKDMVKLKDLRLYFGLALYKIGTDEDSGTWLKKSDNIRSQTEYIRSIGADGYMLFSFGDISKPEVGKELLKIRS